MESGRQRIIWLFVAMCGDTFFLSGDCVFHEPIIFITPKFRVTMSGLLLSSNMLLCSSHLDHLPSFCEWIRPSNVIWYIKSTLKYCRSSYNPLGHNKIGVSSRPRLKDKRRRGLRMGLGGVYRKAWTAALLNKTGDAFMRQQKFSFNKLTGMERWLIEY